MTEYTTLDPLKKIDVIGLILIFSVLILALLYFLEGRALKFIVSSIFSIVLVFIILLIKLYYLGYPLGAKLSVRNKVIEVQGKSGMTKRIPIEQIECIKIYTVRSETEFDGGTSERMKVTTRTGVFKFAFDNNASRRLLKDIFRVRSPCKKKKFRNIEDFPSLGEEYFFAGQQKS